MANRIAVLETNKGTIKFELLEDGRTENDGKFSSFGGKGLLRRRDFSSRDQKFYDSGRRSARRRLRRRIGLGRKI